LADPIYSENDTDNLSLLRRDREILKNLRNFFSIFGSVPE
jgi:hypothetical protein